MHQIYSTFSKKCEGMNFSFFFYVALIHLGVSVLQKDEENVIMEIKKKWKKETTSEMVVPISFPSNIDGCSI